MHLHPALQSCVDQERAELREQEAANPASGWLLMQSLPRSTAHWVALDMLARLSEVADQPVEKQLMIAVARMHAWSEETR